MRFGTCQNVIWHMPGRVLDMSRTHSGHVTEPVLDMWQNALWHMSERELAHARTRFGHDQNKFWTYDIHLPNMAGHVTERVLACSQNASWQMPEHVLLFHRSGMT